MSKLDSTCTSKISDFFNDLQFKDIPEEVVSKAIEHMIDTVGVSINGTKHPEGQPMYEVIAESAGTEEATVWGKNIKVPVQEAALVNGTFCHCIEMDDTHRATYLHAGAFVIPPAIALAEKVGASGEQLIKAVVAGYETGIRVALSVIPEHRFRGFHPTGTIGVFGAAITSALLLQLTKEQTVHAMGLAGTQASGLFQFLYDGCMAKRFHPGKAGHSGILAARLAQKGFTGSSDILEGDYGFGKVMSDRFDANTVTKDLGKHWHIMEMGIKPYSACRFCHAGIDAGLDLGNNPEINVNNIASVEIHGSKQLHDQTGNQTPSTVMGAQLSTPFMVALSLLNGATMPEDVEKGLQNPKVVELARDTPVIINQDLPITSRETEVRLTTNNGNTYKSRIELPLGEPERPLTVDDLKNKFKILSVPVLGEDKAEKLYSTLSEIQKLANCRNLGECFSIED